MRTVTTLLTAAAVLGAAATIDIASAQDRRARFQVRGGPVETEEPAAASSTARRPPPPRYTEAPTGFDNLTNGYLPQGPDFDTLEDDAVVPGRSFNDNRFIFEETEVIADGLGPLYNAQSCRECHQNVVTGGASQVAEHRTGRLDGDEFFESLGGSLVHSRATNASIVERCCGCASRSPLRCAARFC